MRSTFFGLNIGVKALQAQQRALDVTSHNIANANTEGYTRQDVVMETSTPIKEFAGYVGTGVEIGEFRRIRDQFIDFQLRTENKKLGEWEVKSDIMSKLEVIFNEPSESGLGTVLDDYWNAWQELSKNPESTAVRITVVQRGITLAETFNHINTQLTDLQKDINRTIAGKVDGINSMAKQISKLNMHIVKAEADGSKANDLRDKRDLLVEQLSKMVEVDTIEDSTGSVNVTVGGRSLVYRDYVLEMKFTDNEVDPTAATLEWIEPYTNESQGEVNIKSGELKGYLNTRDETVTEMMDSMSELAESIALETNAVHNSGYGLDDNPGVDFFVKIEDTEPFGSGNIMVNPVLVGDETLVAAGKVTPVLQGDGSNALEIAQLRYKLVMGGGTTTFDDYYSSTVAQLGIEAQEAQRMLENQELLTNQLMNKQEAVSGVSLDEEMTNMIKFQHAYSAAARLINVMDEMLETIVNRLGIVGR